MADESDESFDWFDEERDTENTYFVYTNESRKPILPGDQIFYCYGNRTNRFLLLNYGFCFPDNRYESYEVHMKMDLNQNGDLFPPEMVSLNRIENLARQQTVRLKTD